LGQSAGEGLSVSIGRRVDSGTSGGELTPPHENVRSKTLTPIGPKSKVSTLSMTVDTLMKIPSKVAQQPRRNLAAEIVSELRTDIISGVFKPGESLAEPVLANRFGVSRAPVREAIIELERAGLVQFEATGRTRVRILEEKDLAEIVETRIALEAMGARLAAVRWTVEDTDWVKRSIAAQEKATTGAEFSQLDIAMHEYIMKCSGNDRLVALWQYVRWQFEMALAFIHRLQEKLAQDLRPFSIDGHWKVLETLSSRQPEVAAKIMSHHITRSLEWSVPEDGESSNPSLSSVRKRNLSSKLLGWFVLLSVSALCVFSRATAQGDSGGESQSAEMLFFEKEVRPILSNRCYECHGTKKQKGGLRVDHVGYLKTGGDTGPALVPGNPEASPLMEAGRFTNPDFQMPPKEKMPLGEVAVLEKWIKMGAPQGALLEGGFTSGQRNQWCFRPVQAPPPPPPEPVRLSTNL
jgi:DNA-binding GntR family transcriptional regulator